MDIFVIDIFVIGINEIRFPTRYARIAFDLSSFTIILVQKCKLLFNCIIDAYDNHFQRYSRVYEFVIQYFVKQNYYIYTFSI